MKRLLWSLSFFVLVAPARAEAPSAGTVVQELWDAAYLGKAKVGHFHTVVRAIEVDGQKAYRSNVHMDLIIKRYNAIVPLRMDVGSEELATGQVIGLSLTQYVDKNKLTQSGRVVDGKLIVKEGRQTREVPWDDRVIGHYRQERIFQDREVKPGDRFSYRNFELSLLRAVVVNVAVKEPEEVDLLVAGKDGKVSRPKKKLLRVEAVPEKVEIGGGAVQLPVMTAWLDADRAIARSELDLPGLGKITLYRTTKALATAEEATPSTLPDLGSTTLVPLNRQIPRAHEASSIVYRVTVDGDDDPATLFAKDARQQVKNIQGKTFELHVTAVREPRPKENPAKAKPEFLNASHFLDSDHPRIKKLAAEAVGTETDPWRKARRIEQWVRTHMQPNSALGIITASQVARDLEGDCRQHGMLTAAMCRAAGIPARTAVGLVYVHDADGRPVLGFHLWTEVWIDGQWLGLDATLGRGSIGPAHLKISSANWDDTQTLAPLLPVTRAMGKIKVEVVSIKR
jgi:hypothetical protein